MGFQITHSTNQKDKNVMTQPKKEDLEEIQGCQV